MINVATKMTLKTHQKKTGRKFENMLRMAVICVVGVWINCYCLLYGHNILQWIYSNSRVRNNVYIFIY